MGMGMDISKYCEKCEHTGLLPFIKEGKVSPNVHIWCDCHQAEPEYHPGETEEDFDFPCSYSWRSYYHETLKGEGSLPLESSANEPEHPKVPALVPPQVERPLQKEFLELRVMLSHFENKLNKHIDWTKDNYEPF